MSVLQSFDGRDARRLWESFSHALGMDLKEQATLRGSSGLDHPVQAVAFDGATSRLLVIPADASARVSALIQADIQSERPELKVIVARPVIVDLALVLRKTFGPLYGQKVTSDRLKEVIGNYGELPDAERQAIMRRYFTEAFSPVLSSFKNAPLATVNQAVSVINELSMMDWDSIGRRIKESGSEGSIDLSSLVAEDGMETDRRFGVCPIPFYEFAENDWDLMLDPRRTEGLRERLCDLDIFQYFFPPSDQLALGLVDNGFTDKKQIVGAISQSNSLGHLVSQPEIVGEIERVDSVLEALKDQGYIAEGELGYEITSPKGATIRSKITFRPREALIVRILRSLKVDVNFKL